MMHGKGVYTCTDGRSYNGFYYNDKKYGYGEYTFADGKIYKGLFKNGK